MKKIIIAFMILTVIILSFSSCGNKVKYYTNEDGTEYEIVLDSNGNITVKDNLLLVYVLSDTGKKIKNEDGEYRTEYVSFNGQVVDGDYVETETMKFKIPSGFSQTQNSSLLFYCDEYNADIIIKEDSEFEIDSLKNAMEVTCNELQESYGSDKFSYEISEIELPEINVNAYKCEMNCTAADHPMSDYSYYFIYNDKLYTVEASIKISKKNKVDFDKFVKSISFK